MGMLLIWIGRLGGILGIVLAGIAVVTRVGGAFYARGYQVGTLLQAGMALMLLGCLAYAAAIAERPARG